MSLSTNPKFPVCQFITWANHNFLFISVHLKKSVFAIYFDFLLFLLVFILFLFFNSFSFYFQIQTILRNISFLNNNSNTYKFSNHHPHPKPPIATSLLPPLKKRVKPNNKIESRRKERPRNWPGLRQISVKRTGTLRKLIATQIPAKTNSRC